MWYLVVVVCLVAACSSETGEFAEERELSPTPPATVAPTPAPADDAQPDSPEAEPQPYIPAGSPGSASAYADLVVELEELVPQELHAHVPWPDLRNPNPIVAQTDIFDLWIWMAETLTEPQLVEIMAAPGSPSRETVVSVFGSLQSQNIFEVRPGQPYRAFDHRVVTFESAGLPLWLARDVPDGAVVVYYSDSSGVVDVLDQDSGEIMRQQSAIGTRVWLSIMVPTDVGWQLWRDQLIEANDPELEVPDVPPPPGNDVEPRTPEV